MTVEFLRHLEHASGYLDLGMYEDALVEATAALAIESAQPHRLPIKSSALWHLRRLQEAEPCFATLADLNPKDAGLWINLAYIRRRTQSLDAAIETLQRALDADPKDALAHFNM